MATLEPLPPDVLYRRCETDSLAFETTAELAPPDRVLGQERAIDAVGFAVRIARDGYNLYALGPPGLGKHAVVRRIVEARAKDREVPSDWCYVNNFAEPQRPRALALPPGRAVVFHGDMERLVRDLTAAIPAAFDSDEFRARRDAIERAVKEEHEPAMERLSHEAQAHGIALIRTPAGFGFAPVSDGEVMSPEAFQHLPEAERERLQKDIEGLQSQLQEILSKLPTLVKQSRQKLRELIREITRYTARHLFAEVREQYAGNEGVIAYLAALEDDVVDNAEAFMRAEEAGVTRGASSSELPPVLEQSPAQLVQLQIAQRYAVNVVVDRTGLSGAPVVYEDHPTFQRLVGDIEHIAQMGTLMTDFRLIKPGALHAANGGYLILDARKLLTQPFAYDGLKRALKAREIRVESLGQALSLISTRSIEPQAIPLDLKVVLIGEGLFYYLLSLNDPEFDELFKVAADFDDRVVRDRDNALLYARLIADLAHSGGLRPLDRAAVARTLEHGARLAGDAERLSLSVERLSDLLREADYWCAEAGREVIGIADIEHAIAARIRRSSRLKDRLQEETERGTILIATDGARVGQINGLSVIALGGFAFGRPSRITARVRLGKGEVIDIEREVALGGPLHSKGMLILAGFLGARYAGERPLTLSASLVFEQSYSGVDGDSASSAELYALLSALAEVPIRQSLAVTGSVNQLGDVQAIGGVNEKIEGFFDLCRARGLTGDQGVLIPEANVKHLMLKREVVEAVEAGRFRVYPIATVDQGIEVLTGMAAGERDAEGRFPEGSINFLVDRRLQHLAERARAFAARPEDKA